MTTLLELFPEMFEEDAFFVRFIGAFDAILEPIHGRVAELDRLADTRAAPPDLIDWMCFWLGWNVSTDWPALNRKRALLAASGYLLRSRGTVQGLRALIEVVGGIDVAEVSVEDGGWVVTPDETRPPYRRDARGLVRVRISGDITTTWSEDDRRMLERLAARDLPAGCRMEVTFVTTETASASAPERNERT